MKPKGRRENECEIGLPYLSIYKRGKKPRGTTVNPEAKDPISDRKSGKDSISDAWITTKDG